MPLRLFDWGPSPFCLKVRSLLAYKGVSYQRIPVLGPSLPELLRRSAVRKVPALDIDGQFYVDSTDIAHEIERRFPEPATVPADRIDRGRCHALEDWADESLYFIGLYFQWLDARGRPMVRQAFGRTPLGWLAHQFYRRRIAAQVRGQGTGRKPVAHIQSDLRRQFQALTDMLADGRPYLLGERPMLCDFSVNAQLVYLSRPPGSAALLAEFPVLADYRGRMRALREPAAQGA